MYIQCRCYTIAQKESNNNYETANIFLNNRYSTSKQNDTKKIAVQINIIYILYKIDNYNAVNINIKELIIE